MIIGTAGHIDHGKTTLVRALTGEETDRLKEEKERGISIDLGFAHFDLPDGSRAGVVDVPGHERFIRNMLAGAHGIDLVLFTVAADDGVMPQTEEHLDILHLLGIERAIFVITKADLAGESRLREVEDEIRILIEGTSLEHSPILPFSFVTGRGLPELRDRIVVELREQRDRRSRGYFRLPVDRAFALQGHGLVVTGTALDGEVRVGDRVRALPGDQIYRVRSVQVHDQPVEVATYGQRVALNLSGPDRGSIARGDVICDERLASTTVRFDALLEVRPSGGAVIKSHQRVRVHAGTSERIGTIVLLDSRENIGAKQSAFCQIALREPVLVLRGDRFVIRDETARHTLAGGTVVHPWAAKHKRSEADLEQTLRTLHRGNTPDVAAAFIAGSRDFAVPVGRLCQFLNLRQDEVEKRIAQAPAIQAFCFEEEKLYTTEQRVAEVREEVLRSVREHHAAHPLSAGMDVEELRAKLRYDVTPRLFRAFVEELEAAKTVTRDANLLRLPGHRTALADPEQRIASTVKTLLAKDPLSPPDLKQIEAEIGIARSKMLDVLRVLEREGAIVRVAPDLYFLAEAVADMKSAVHQRLAATNKLTPALFRELFGTSRKYTIPLLEYLDREGVTIRVGDVRRLRKQPLSSR